ncbi:hypothetical protein GCM10010215_74240 [Streptomyces virginiae]|uniref:Uncharacterized protein n=1 Tax=Streptomyces virginiae TaxID=1961 RepID=A0ABQ3NNX6_STRVG|nr:hypothetical protein GCM10010215_74240 [Streptomyces virginiae]GHI14497.1 hypothetical protein Scinn_39600 [Streptomyces virginiae]GLV93000.1 hypothetical protein Slala04_44540 [Streptomyces lavendulae subsp. lavendulae]
MREEELAHQAVVTGGGELAPHPQGQGLLMLGWAMVAVRIRAVTRSGWRAAARMAIGPPSE